MIAYAVIRVEGAGARPYRDAVLALWTEVLTNASWPGRFEWLYDDNPAGRTTTWLAVSPKSGEVAGGNSLYARRLYVNGTPVLMGIAADFAIHAPHRVFGPALQMQREIVAQSAGCGYALNFAYPNASGDAVFIRAGYRVLGSSIRYLKLLNIRHKVAGSSPLKSIARAAAMLCDVFLNACDAARLAAAGRKYQTEVATSADGRFDALWESVRNSYVIIGEKSSSYLNWRYTACNGQKCAYYCLVDKNTKVLKGYIVYSRMNGIAYVQEALAVKDPGVFRHLLLSFSMSMRADSANVILLSFLGDPDFVKLLYWSGFIKRESERNCLLFVHQKDIEKQVFSRKNWFLFEGEMDL